MQALYSYEKDHSFKADQLKKKTETSIQNFYRLYIVNLYILTKSIEYVNTIVQQNATKHIAVEGDKDLSVRLFHNPIIQRIVLDPNFIEYVKKDKLDLRIEDSIFKKYFNNLLARNSYKKYNKLESTDIADDYYLLSELYTDVIIADEDFDSIMEEIYPSWADDKAAVIALVNTTLIALKDKPNKKGINAPSGFREEIKLANELIDVYFNHGDEFIELIKPRLKNWDEDRIAEVDMLLMKMGVSEMLYQPEIPLKVTINEYLEIAKLYSTPNSSDFINGILDSVLKELKTTNRLQKTGRGIVEN